MLIKSSVILFYIKTMAAASQAIAVSIIAPLIAGRRIFVSEISEIRF